MRVSPTARSAYAENPLPQMEQKRRKKMENAKKKREEARKKEQQLTGKEAAPDSDEVLQVTVWGTDHYTGRVNRKMDTSVQLPKVHQDMRENGGIGESQNNDEPPADALLPPEADASSPRALSLPPPSSQPEDESTQMKHVDLPLAIPLTSGYGASKPFVSNLTPGPGQYNTHILKTIGSAKPQWSMSPRPPHLHNNVPTWITTTLSNRLATGPEPPGQEILQIDNHGAVRIPNKTKFFGGKRARFIYGEDSEAMVHFQKELLGDSLRRAKARPLGLGRKDPIVPNSPMWSQSKLERGKDNEGFFKIDKPGPGSYELADLPPLRHSSSVPISLRLKQYKKTFRKGNCTFGKRPSNLPPLIGEWTPETFLTRYARSQG